MGMNSKKIAGTLLFVGTAQFLFMMILAEMLYPGYSVANNFISDLGVGATAPIFNSSIILFGVMLVLAGFFIRRGYKDEYYPEVVALSGVGALGVGLFPETTGDIHLSFAFIAFFFGAIAAIMAYKLEKIPLRYISIILGIISLAALVLGSVFGIDLGLGRGGMERMIVYPILVWGIAFGGQLMAE